MRRFRCVLRLVDAAALPIAVMLGFACGYAAAQTVSLTAPKPLRYGVDAWPLIDAPSTPAQDKINAKLTHLNAVMLRSLKDCDAGYNEALKQMGPDAKGQEPASKDTERQIKVTMHGPRYLSMVATDFADCGGAHPNSDTEVMVFDLISGAPVNWLALIEKSAGASAYADTVMDGTTEGAVVVPNLAAIYKGAKGPGLEGCAETFARQQPFLIWPDARKGTLDVEAFDLPHGVAACAVEMDLSPAQAKKLGFSSVLLDAINAAHAGEVRIR